MTKKILLVGLVVLLATGMLFAQGGKEQTAAEGPIEITFWSLFTGGDGEFFDAILSFA